MKLLIAALFLAALPLQPFVLADATASAGGPPPTTAPGPVPPSTPPPPPCSYCSTFVSPVCGTDGKTYRNKCFLQCQSILNQINGLSPIFLAYNWPCIKEKCLCSTQIDPRCASDDKTYGNQCLLDCENDRRFALGQAPLTVKYYAACIKCPCTNINDPVCASDKKTYKNPCLLKCENDIRKASGLSPLTTLYKGICKCDCKNYYDPVCGSDNHDYKNICLLKCESDKRVLNGLSPIYLAYGGPCKCDCSLYSKFYNPVCGDDGKTYWNSGWLMCCSLCNIARQQPPIKQVKPGYC